MFYCSDCRGSREGLVDHRISCARCNIKLTSNYLFQEQDALVCETCRENQDSSPATLVTAVTELQMTVRKQRVEETIVEQFEGLIQQRKSPWMDHIIELRKDEAVGSTLGSGQCGSRRRPDVYMLLDRSHRTNPDALAVVVEVDEYQHKSYSCECEQGRMLEIANELLSQSMGLTKLVFVRLNPDSYAVNGTVKRSYRGKAEITKRVLELDRVVQLLYNHELILESGKYCGVAYLYYDDYNGFELHQL